MSKTNGRSGEKAEASAAPHVRWDDANMVTTYANICNVAGTREEVSLFFGTNVSWQGGQEEVRVRLDHRMLINPYTAKRLHLMLTNLLQEHERRFGSIQLDTVPSAAPPASGTDA